MGLSARTVGKARRTQKQTRLPIHCLLFYSNNDSTDAPRIEASKTSIGWRENLVFDNLEGGNGS